MNTTEKRIIKMLKENTGIALCDSGMDDGRHWQRNQKRDFKAEPAVQYDKYGACLSTFHYLKDRIAVTPSSEVWDGRFRKLFKDRQMSEVEEFLEMFGFDSEVFNTYNGECLLDQTLQYATFERDGTTFVILQIHGGADVRGGYTDARIFEVVEDMFGYDVADLEIETADGRTFRTENGYNFENIDDSNEKLEYPELYPLLPKVSA